MGREIWSSGRSRSDYEGPVELHQDRDTYDLSQMQFGQQYQFSFTEEELIDLAQAIMDNLRNASDLILTADSAFCPLTDLAIRTRRWSTQEEFLQIYRQGPPYVEDLGPGYYRPWLRPNSKVCPTCQNESTRVTVALVCQTCGRDYMLEDPKPTKEF